MHQLLGDVDKLRAVAESRSSFQITGEWALTGREVKIGIEK
jgi:hypothetical protein